MKQAYTAAAALLVCAACAGPLAALAGCASPPPREQELAGGNVQGEIKVGMDAASVAEVLGSPNIVRTDELNREVWIYENIASDRVDTRSVGHSIVIFAEDVGSPSSPADARTLTIIIQYDEEKKVRDFAYNYSAL